MILEPAACVFEFNFLLQQTLVMKLSLTTILLGFKMYNVSSHLEKGRKGRRYVRTEIFQKTKNKKLNFLFENSKLSVVRNKRSLELLLLAAASLNYSWVTKIAR